VSATDATSDASTLPPLAVLESALNLTTEFLALQASTPHGSTPDWDDFEWRIAEAVAALQGMSSLLADTLPWRGPQRWQAFLSEQRRHCILREQRIVELLSRIDAASREKDIACVALKGAALVKSGIYRMGERPMGDIDLLVREDDFDIMAATLLELGYRRGFVMSRHVTFEPPGTGNFTGFGEHIDNPLRIEVHTRIAERLPASQVDITLHTLPVSPVPGVNAYPSIAALMRHLLLHAAGNMRARALRQIQLHDIALLASHMNGAAWSALIDAPEARESWWMLPPLLLVARYYPIQIPDAVRSRLEAACPRWLRRTSMRQRLSDVSWSKIRIEAFPGIEWSRSPREAASFARTRLLPSRTDLAVLAQYAAMPSCASSIPWYGQSHARRMLRWIFGKPPRVQTAFSVRAALERQESHV